MLKTVRLANLGLALGLGLGLGLAGCTETPEDHLHSLSERMDANCGSLDTTCLAGMPQSQVSCLQQALDTGRVARLDQRDRRMAELEDTTTLVAADHQIWMFTYSSNEQEPGMDERACSGGFEIRMLQEGFGTCFDVVAPGCL